MEEIWKDIEGFEGFYQASNLGRIKRMERRVKSPLWNQETAVLKEKILKLQKRRGYEKIVLTRETTCIQSSVHRIIAKTFIPNPLNKPMINHKNAITNDNRVENLEWCTDSENKIHAIMFLGNGLGERNGASKLTKEQVLKIRRIFSTGKYFHGQIATMFGVSRKLICCIVNRKNWTHI